MGDFLSRVFVLTGGKLCSVYSMPNEMLSKMQPLSGKELWVKHLTALMVSYLFHQHVQRPQTIALMLPQEYNLAPASETSFTSPYFPPLFFSHSLCTPRDLPQTVQSCILPKDCQLTEWADWGPCSKVCLDPQAPSGTRTRSRRVLLFPVGEGAECAHLEETEPCEPQGDGVPPCATWVSLDNMGKGGRGM